MRIRSSCRIKISELSRYSQKLRNALMRFANEKKTHKLRGTKSGSTTSSKWRMSVSLLNPSYQSTMRRYRCQRRNLDSSSLRSPFSRGCETPMFKNDFFRLEVRRWNLKKRSIRTLGLRRVHWRLRLIRGWRSYRKQLSKNSVQKSWSKMRLTIWLKECKGSRECVTVR